MGANGQKYPILLETVETGYLIPFLQFKGFIKGLLYIFKSQY